MIWLGLAGRWRRNRVVGNATQESIFLVAACHDLRTVFYPVPAVTAFRTPSIRRR
jgi:hypothetical protein